MTEEELTILQLLLTKLSETTSNVSIKRDYEDTLIHIENELHICKEVCIGSIEEAEVIIK